MKPWREVAVPQKDVREGRFQQAEFAADLSAVHTGRAVRSVVRRRRDVVVHTDAGDLLAGDLA